MTEWSGSIPNQFLIALIMETKHKWKIQQQLVQSDFNT